MSNSLYNSPKYYAAIFFFGVAEGLFFIISYEISLSALETKIRVFGATIILSALLMFILTMVIVKIKRNIRSEERFGYMSLVINFVVLFGFGMCVLAPYFYIVGLNVDVVFLFGVISAFHNKSIYLAAAIILKDS